jgi:hypothetical protein
MKPEIISDKKVYQGKVFDVFLSKIREGEVEYESCRFLPIKQSLW